MPVTAHVHQVFIAATPEQVWTALTDSAWTRRYFHGTAFVEPPAANRPFRTVRSDGSPAVDGVIEEMSPPVDGAPGRFVHTWHVGYDPELAVEPPSRVEWTVEAAGEGLTRVRLVHSDLAESPLTWVSVRNGWAWVLDSLKSVLETGSGLPRWTAADDDTDVRADDGAWHRQQGIAATNGGWELIAQPERTPDQDEDLLRHAYAAAYHWQRATDRTPANEARSRYLIAKALLLTGQPEAALRSADASLASCLDAGLTDFDLAYAHEARARALAALGRRAEADDAWALATEVEIADPEDRRIVAADFAAAT